MRLPLNLEIAALALGDRDLLATLATWARDDDRPRLRNDLPTRLREALKRTAHRQIGHSSLHQLDGAIKLACDRSGPLALTAATHLADSLLCVGRDGPALQFSHALHYQRVVTAVAPDHLWAAFLVHQRSRQGPGEVLAASQIRQLVHAPLLPSVTEPGLAELKHRGLPEHHRHFNGSALLDQNWPRLMTGAHPTADTSQPGAPRPGFHRLVQVARGLRACLVEWVSGLQDAESFSTRVRPLLIAAGSEGAQLHSGAFSRGLRWRRGRIVTDPAASLPGAQDDEPLFGERALLICLFTQLQRLDDTPLRARLWAGAASLAYLLIRNQLQQRETQPLTGAQGLDRFDTVFRDGTLRDSAEEQLDGAARLVQAMRVGGVHWLEARLTPSGEPANKMRRFLDAAEDRRTARRETPGARLRAELRRDHEPSVHGRWHASMRPDPTHDLPAVGFIFHFVRAKPDPLPRASVADAMPRLQYGELRARVAEEGRRLHRILDDADLAPFFCGLDVAGVETHAPVDVFAPTIRLLRAQRGMQRRHHRIGHVTGLIPSLSLTCHAGEEFFHILGGLRSMDEAMTFLDMSAGDRLGHCLAAGLDVEQWMSSQGFEVILSRGDRLDDLVWFGSMLNDINGFAHPTGRIDDEISRLSHQLYGVAYTRAVLRRAWRLRRLAPEAFSRTPRRFGDREQAAIETDTDARECHYRYLFDTRCHRERAELMIVRCDPSEVAAITKVQDHMLGHMTERRIAIEVNPTSNLSISCIDDLRQHPIFRWHRPDLSPTAPRPHLVINTDNPGITSSELIHEYTYLARAAELRGTPTHRIWQWLAELRREGLQFSFLDRASHWPVEVQRHDA